MIDKNKKNMLILLPKISVGGMEQALINLLNKSDYCKNFNVTLIIGYVVDKDLVKQLPENLTLKILCENKFDSIGKLKAIINYGIEYIKIITKCVKYDVAICYSPHHSVLAEISRSASKNNIIFIHNNLEKARTKKQISKMKFEKFSKVVCVSNASKEGFLKLFPNYKGNIVVANNYIDGEKILRLADEQIVDEKILDDSKDKIIFVNMCRHLEDTKKVSRILESSKRLKKEGYKFIVWLVGDGPDNKIYRELVEKDGLQNVICFIGKKINPYPYLKNSNAHILSSAFEGYGIVLDEARILNIPSISTDVADAKEIMHEGYGILCENTSQGVYNGMKEFLEKGYTITKEFNYVEFNRKITETLNNILN